MFHNKANFYGEELSTPRPTPKIEDHPSSAVRGCLFDIFAGTLHTGGSFTIRNLRTRHAVVTGTHLSQFAYQFMSIIYTFHVIHFFLVNYCGLSANHALLHAGAPNSYDSYLTQWADDSTTRHNRPSPMQYITHNSKLMFMGAHCVARTLTSSHKCHISRYGRQDMFLQ